MNPYTSIWAGVTPGDGPQDFHLVLLDNGRTAVLADEVGREALHCIRCSACLNVCPVYERAGGHAYGSVYPGPIGAILSPQLTGVEDNASLPYASSLCGACYDVCPVAIDIPSILVHLRGEHVEAVARERTRPTAEAVAFGALARAMSSPRLWRLAQRAAGLGRFLSRGGPTLPRLPRPGSRLDPLPGPAHPAGADLPAVVGPGERRWPVVSAREEVLGRIRTALGPDRPVPAPVVRDYRLTDDRPAAALLDLLADRVADYRATVARCGPDQVATTVQRVLAEALGERDPAEVVHAPGLPADWRPAGARADDDRPAVELAAGAAAVTGVAVAIAETGTLVLDGSPMSGRRALSLLPDCLVCVVTADQVVGSVPEALGRLDPLRPLTMISGPSATSDIELQRVEGVHGPRTLLVVLVDATGGG